jgi:hypothetical protein
VRHPELSIRELLSYRSNLWARDCIACSPWMGPCPDASISSLGERWLTVGVAISKCITTDHELPLYMKSVRLALPILNFCDVLIGCSGSMHRLITPRSIWCRLLLHPSHPYSRGRVTLRRFVCAAYPSPTRPSRVAGCG